MSATEIILLVVVSAALVIGAAFFYRMQRSKRLREKFGPEYSRVVEETGSRTRGEARLEKLQKRVQKLNIQPLRASDRAQFVDSWRLVQARFVDEPQGSVGEADALVQNVMTARGYPVSTFEQNAEDISVDHPLVVEQYRAGHAIAMRQAEGRASTEDLRQAMIHYRTLFDELVRETEAPQVRRAASGRG